MNPIILASASPRRQDFFRLMGIPFTCIPAMIDETPLPGLSPRLAAEDLARRKALAVTNRHPKPLCLGALVRGLLKPAPPIQWIFAADTIVVLNGEIFGKPTDRDDARHMLERLSGQRHEVITAMALCNTKRNTQGAAPVSAALDCRSKTSEVVFAPLTGAEIEWYLDSGEWEGAAGAYRLQGLGACLIESVNGSPSGVAGLPLFDFYVMLKDNGLI